MRIIDNKCQKLPDFYMKKKIQKNLFISAFLLLSAVFGGEDELQAKEKVLASFQQMFELKLSQGDKTAIDLAEKAKAKAGRLDLEMAEMQQIMLKWDPASKALFKNLKTTKEKVEEVKKAFEEILKKKVKEEDPQALSIAKKGEARGGKLELSVRQMQELILKWEKGDGTGKAGN